MVITETLSGHESVCTTAKSGQADLEPELHQRKSSISGKQKTAHFTSSAHREITYALFETDIDSIPEEKEDEEKVLEKTEEKSLTAATSKSPSVVKDLSMAIFNLYPTRKYEYVWLNIFGMIGLHLGAALGYLLVPRAHVATLIWAYALLLLGTLGVQAGAHRLWCHKVKESVSV